MFQNTLALLLSGALAQAPAIPVPAPGGALPSSEAPAADKRFVTEETELLRWPDATVVSATVNAGDEVEILARGDGGLVRVRRGMDFGWIQESRLAESAPAP